MLFRSAISRPPAIGAVGAVLAAVAGSPALLFVALFVYGAGNATNLQARYTGADLATPARRGKDDRTDAVAAAEKVLNGMATAIPKDTTGSIEAIRVLTVVRDSAVRERTQTLNQVKDLRITAPAALRETLDGFTLEAIAKKAARFRTEPARLAEPAHALKHALKRLGERFLALEAEIKAANTELDTLVAAVAPTLLSRPGIGTHTAARFLISAGSNIDRFRNDAAFARLCGAAPVPVSSGKTHRMRLHRGGDRQANRALHMIIVGRMKNHADTKAYIAKKLAAGHSKRDAMRALKRFLARQVFNDLKTDLLGT